MRFTAILLLMLLYCANAEAGICADDGHVAGQCYSLRAVMRMDANMGASLWSAEEDRSFTVPPESVYPWPANLAQSIEPDSEVFGDFRICPLKPAEEGAVCIDAASNLAMRPISFDQSGL